MKYWVLLPRGQRKVIEAEDFADAVRQMRKMNGNGVIPKECDSVMTRETMFKDLLQNCSKSENIGHIEYKRGIYTAFITTICGLYNLDCKSAMEYAKAYLPTDFDDRSIPLTWRQQ